MVVTQKVSHNMTDFIIKKLPYDLTSNAGLVLVGNAPPSSTVKFVSR